METKRLLLRHWRETDAETLYALASDPDIGSRAGWAPHQTIEESRNVIQTIFNDDTTWAIVLKETEEVIGAIGYGASCDCKLPAREGEPIAGYWIGKAYWNKGYCTEALAAIIEHVRHSTLIPSLICGHFTDNVASRHVMLKCGFLPTGETAYDEQLYAGKQRPISILRLEIPR